MIETRAIRSLTNFKKNWRTIFSCCDSRKNHTPSLLVAPKNIAEFVYETKFIQTLCHVKEKKNCTNPTLAFSMILKNLRGYVDIPTPMNNSIVQTGKKNTYPSSIVMTVFVILILLDWKNIMKLIRDLG